MKGSLKGCAVNIIIDIEGREAIASWRAIMGATDPAKAAPGTIRGDLATVLSENVPHGSDSPESAAREIALFFPGLPE